MDQELYSVDQVAELLNLHVRTVRNYVREGRLKAVRIGKQYRIAREDLEAMTGRPVAEREPVRRHRYIEVSSIVEIDAISQELAMRLINALTAMPKGGSEGDQPFRVETLYYEERARLKVILTGSIATVGAFQNFISMYLEAQS